MFKKVLLLFLSFVVIISLAGIAYASDDETKPEHVCTFDIWTSYEYENPSNSTSYHIIRILKNYDCTDKNCPIRYSEVVSEREEPHHIAMMWTGEHYHSGSNHYCYYQVVCRSCRYTNYNAGEWRSYPCPGGMGKGCILPANIPPIYKIM